MDDGFLFLLVNIKEDNTSYIFVILLEIHLEIHGNNQNIWIKEVWKKIIDIACNMEIGKCMLCCSYMDANNLNCDYLSIL